MANSGSLFGYLSTDDRLRGNNRQPTANKHIVRMAERVLKVAYNKN